MNRIDSLDWQRGLLACSIMFYHLTSWLSHPLDASEFLGRLGIYSVSMFFVLSGLSMAHVYNTYICDIPSSIKFLIRRIFRIWPVLWLAIFVAELILNKNSGWQVILLNITTLFGFFNPGAYINTGAWSIGNEMVYYFLTPLLIFLFNKDKLYGNIFTIVTVLIGLYFSSYQLTSAKTLAAQWSIFINPLNNLFFYSAGVAVFYNFKGGCFKKTAIVILGGIGLMIFIYYPAHGDLINLVTGGHRIVFSVVSIISVVVFYKNPFHPPNLTAAVLSALGLITYSVYIFHPLVYQLIVLSFKKIHLNLPVYLLVTLSITTTMLVSWFSFILLEKPFIRLGKVLTA